MPYSGTLSVTLLLKNCCGLSFLSRYSAVRSLTTGDADELGGGI